MQIPSEPGTFHIVGIGGIGMSAIAEILRAKGHTVQGSDQKDSANVKRLRAKGIRVFVGHDPINLVGARYVVISTAVKEANPELKAAREKGLTIIRRAEMLAELMRLYSTISITGTHGKTTTTSLVAHIFVEAGLEPTVITGGIINGWGSNARLGAGPWMVVEADESDGTFIKIPSQIGVVTNIDPEHLDYFGTVEEMHEAYRAFYRNIPFYGLAMTCIDHPVARAMVEDLGLRRDGRRLLTYGVDPTADLVLTRVHIEGATTIFDATLGARVAGGARELTGWSVPVPGAHNALNALAAIGVAAEAGIKDEAIRGAMAGFTGVKRRFQQTGTWNGARFYDDYGHHPVEISAVLAAARAGAKGRVIAIVEPHRYTRVQSLFQRLLRLLQGCRRRHRGASVFGRRVPHRGHRFAVTRHRHRTDRTPQRRRRRYPAGSRTGAASTGGARRHRYLFRRRQFDRMGARAARLARRDPLRAGSAI